MRVFRAHAIDFRSDETRSSEHGVSLGAGAPIAVFGLLTVKAGIRLAFSQSIENHEECERLDTYLVQPTCHYISQISATEELRGYVGDGRASWSFFMISGIRVARSGNRSMRESRKVEVEGGPEIDIPTAATVKATGDVSRENPRKMEEEGMSDFVWAVRLAKIHKGLLMTDWSVDPYTHGATFSVGGGEEVDVGAVLKNEGMENFTVMGDDELGEAIILPNQ